MHRTEFPSQLPQLPQAAASHRPERLQQFIPSLGPGRVGTQRGARKLAGDRVDSDMLRKNPCTNWRVLNLDNEWDKP